MPKAYLRAGLAKFGPCIQPVQAMLLEQARAYCRKLARTHYENFTVAHFLMPGRLRQHFCNLYAYCRWGDDLADEIADREESLVLLDWWEGELRAMFAGDGPRHPVLIALADTTREFSIPQQPLRDLLIAFRQDRSKTRYETFAELLGYCRHSADPVGRLVLHLGRCYNEQSAELSDSICTGLQLANFCQDVARDFEQGRIYIPREDWLRFGYGEEQFAAHEASAAFRGLMEFQVARAEECLRKGEPLVRLVSPELRTSIRLFVDGGLAILAAIRRQRYDVWSRRPVVSKWTKLCLLMRATLRRDS